MLRRSLLILPLVAAVAGAMGAVVGGPLLAGVLGAAAGVLAQLLLAHVLELRVRRVADRVGAFLEGDTTSQLEEEGSGEWRRLMRALNEVGRSLDERFGQLAEERERVTRLLDGLPPAVLLFTDGGLAYANPSARRLLDADEGAMSRSPLQVLGTAALADAVTEAWETGRTVEVEVEREGRQLTAQASTTTRGETALVVSDLTALRRVEAVRRDFVTNASHELKTPVAGIQALAESLQLALERDPARARRMIDRLQTEAVRLAQLVRELLDLARLEDDAAAAGRRVDVAGMVRSHLERVAEVARQRDVTLRLDLPAEAHIVAIPEDLRLIVANLVDNAIQYNRPGGHVDARVRREDGEVVLEVADDGIGIAEAEQNRIFERFYRVDKARSRAVGGTGLGLAIVRHAVQRHGGRISVQSVLGHGTTFTVRLPVAPPGD